MSQYPAIKEQVYRTAEERREAARQRSVMALHGETVPTKVCDTFCQSNSPYDK